MAEIQDDDLFTMTEKSCFGDCPICCLPQSIDVSTLNMMGCCSQLICNGCSAANSKREIEAGLQQRCTFCREPLPKSKEEGEKIRMKSVKKNVPGAMFQMGQIRQAEGDYKSAFEYFMKAAELGDAVAHFNLAGMYRVGKGVEKDTKKMVHHLEQAAIRGHPNAINNLGCMEMNNGRFERAVKHLIISASLGLHNSLQALRHIYANGHASKEEYLGALRAYQAAVEATKSSDREIAEEEVKSGKITII